MLTKFYISHVTRNVFSHTFGQLISLIINLLAIAFAARYLGVSEFGLFNYLLSIVVFIAKLIDLGIAPNIFREYSIDKEIGLINTGVLLRCLSFFIVTFIFNITCFILKTDTIIILIYNLFFLNHIISSKGFFRELFEIPFKTVLKVHLPIITMLIDNVIFLALVLIMPIIKGGLTYFVTVYAISNLPGFIIVYILIKRIFNYKFAFNNFSAMWLLKKSFPMYLYIILNTAYLYSDLFFLKEMESSFSVGIYSAAIRLIFPMLIIPTALIHTIFPKLVNNYKNSPAKNIPLIKLVSKTSFLLSFVVAIIVSFKSSQIVSIIYGADYINSAEPLTILLWSQIFMFYSFFIINLLVAYDKQASVYVFSIATLFINIVCNLFLIPNYSYLGASYSKFISIFLGFIITAFTIFKLDGTPYLFEKNMIVFTVIVSISCYLISFLNLYLYLILAFIMLVIDIIYLKYFNASEVKTLLKLFNKENWYQKGLLMNYKE